MSDKKDKNLNDIFDFLMEQKSTGFGLPNYGKLVDRVQVDPKRSAKTTKDSGTAPSGETPSGTAPVSFRHDPRAPENASPEQQRLKKIADKNDKTKFKGVSPEDEKRIRDQGYTNSGLAIANFMIHRNPPKSGRCNVDFENNAVWYFFAGGLMSWTLSPILAPLTKGATSAAGGIVRTVLTPWRAPSNFAINYNKFVRAAPNAPRGFKLPAALAVRYGQMISRVLIKPATSAVGGFTRALTNTVAAPVQTFAQGQSIAKIGTSGGDVIWQSIKGVKTLGYYACLIALAYYFYKQTDASQQALDNEKMEKYRKLIESGIEGILISDMVLEFAAAQGINLDRECSIENLIWGTVWFSLIGVGLGGAAASSMAGRAPKIKSYDDFKAAVNIEKNIQYTNLESLLKAKFTSLAGKNPTLKKLPAGAKEEYYTLLKKGDIENAYQLARRNIPPNTSDDAVKAAQNKLVEDLNTQGKKFWGSYRKGTLETQNSTKELLNTARGNSKQVRRTLQRSLNTQKNFVLNKAGAVPSGSNFSTMKSSNYVDDTLRTASNSSISHQVDDLTALQNKISTGLKDGQLGPLEAITIYERNFLPKLSSVDDQLQNLINNKLKSNGYSKISATQSSEISVQILNNLKAINKSDDFFDAIIANLGGPNAFKNAPLADPLIMRARASGLRANSILENQILKSNRALKPSDLKRLGKELNTFNDNMAKAAGLKSGNLSNIEKLPGALVVLGASAAAIYYINKFREEIEDIRTWRSCNLARALVWSDFRPWPSRHDYNQEALFLIGQDTSQNSMMTRSIYINHIYDKVPETLLNFVKINCGSSDALQQFQNKLGDLKLDSDVLQDLIMDLSEEYSNIEVIKETVWGKWGLRESSSRGPGDTFKSKKHEEYFNKWIPIFIKIMVINSDFDNRLIDWIENNKNKPNIFCEAENLMSSIKKEVWSFRNEDMIRLQNNFRKCFEEEKKKAAQKSDEEAKDNTEDLSSLEINRKNILVIGDSTANNLIQYNTGLQDGGNRTAILTTRRNGKGYPGWSNHHAWGALGTTGILNNLKSNKNFQAPKVAIIHMGYNDFAEKSMDNKTRRERQVEKTLGNFRKTIQFLKSKGTRDIRVFGTKMGEELAINRPNNDKAFKSLDRGLIALCDSLSGVTYQRNTFVTNDGLHYGPKSSKTMLNAILRGPRGSINGLTNEDVDSLARMLSVETSMLAKNSPRGCLAVAFKRMQLRPEFTAKQIVGPKLPSYQWNNSDAYRDAFNRSRDRTYRRAKGLVLSFDTEAKRNKLINEFKNATNFVHPNAMKVGGSNKLVKTNILSKISGWEAGGTWRPKNGAMAMPPWIFNDLKDENKIPNHLFVPAGTVVLMTRSSSWTRFEKKKKRKNEGVITTMNKNLLKELVKEMLNENYGKGYAPYPYHSEIGMEDEESPDFIQDWKDFEMSVCRDESRSTAIKVAKLLVKDLELFGDVIDLVGKNQSVATEILKKYRDSE